MILLRNTRSTSGKIWPFLLVILILVGTGLVWYHLRPAGKIGHKPPGLQPVVVCIDPGHPSESNTARTVQNGTTELAMNWQVAVKLRDVLERDKRIKVVMTRDAMDQYLRNRQRALIANDACAALAIHLHCDTGPSRGFTVYYPDQQGFAEGLRGPSDEIIQASHEAAIAIHSNMVEVLHDDLRDRGIKGESVTRIGRINGGLTVSIWSMVPTTTIEMVFLSNPGDARFIKSQRGQDKMAEALAAGIKQYIKPQLLAYDRMKKGNGRNTRASSQRP